CGLGHGREAIPFGEAPVPGSGTARTAGSEEEDALLGLPFLRRGGRLRWVLPIAGLLLFVALGVAIWQSLPDNRRQGTVPGPKGGPEAAVTPNQETQPKKPVEKPVEKPKD